MLGNSNNHVHKTIGDNPTLFVVDLGMDIGQCDTRGSQLRGFWECLGHNSYSSLANKSGRDSRTAAVILQPERKLS